MPCTDGGVPYGTLQSARYEYLSSTADALQKITPFTYEAINQYRASQDDIDKLARKMCEFITAGGDVLENIIYNGRNRNARIVAEWWDEHKEVDKQRKAYEAEAAAKKKAKEDRKKARAEITEWFKVNSVSYPLSKEQWILINN